jgi:hypothetical protein
MCNYLSGKEDPFDRLRANRVSPITVIAGQDTSLALAIP